MIFRLGITGGIGSGKSTVSRAFNVLGIPVFSADEEGRKIMDTDPGLKTDLNRLIGEDMYPGGILDRTGLASLIFNDKELLQKVNNLVHPRVLDKYEKWCLEQDATYAVFETAILFEAGVEKYVDKVVAVIAPVNERINRVMERSKMSREQVVERMNNQMGGDDLASRSDFVINNSETSMIIPRVLEIHESILSIINK